MSSNVYTPLGQAPAKSEFKVPGKLDIATNNIYSPSKASKTWSEVKGSNNGFSDESLVATMSDFEKLYRTDNVEHGFGVLYADGATTTQKAAADVYGWCRHDDPAVRDKRGMCGLFVYNFNPKDPNNQYSCRSIFFPIGRSGYGHRRHWDGNDRNGVLRYSCGRTEEFPLSAAYYQPLFHDLFMRKGAIYWARKYGHGIDVADRSWPDAMGLDINFFTFDVNLISRSNVQKNSQWSGSTDANHLDACFLRCVGHQSRGRNEK